MSMRTVLLAILAKAGDAIPKELMDEARAALGDRFGLPESQEPKFDVSERGRIINRSSRVEIPADEPIIILRAKDIHAAPTVRRYVDLVSEAGHRDAGFERYQRFIEFASQHPKRMREPD